MKSRLYTRRNESSFNYRVSRLLRLHSGSNKKKEKEKKELFSSLVLLFLSSTLSSLLPLSEINQRQRFTKEEGKKRNIKSVGTTPLRKSLPAKGGAEFRTRERGKKLGQKSWSADAKIRVYRGWEGKSGYT